jgi:hypothetical protein
MGCTAQHNVGDLISWLQAHQPQNRNTIEQKLSQNLIVTPEKLEPDLNAR